MPKLIRDNIPAIITSQGRKPVIRVLSEGEFTTALYDKLNEEVKELIETKTREEKINELADLQELMKTIASHEHISEKEIEVKRLAKKKSNGGFETRILLEGIE
jgi:predicted house-cleaning noncanonical NTP pyrophosphatase (MazG superfamily)